MLENQEVKNRSDMIEDVEAGNAGTVIKIPERQPSGDSSI